MAIMVGSVMGRQVGTGTGMVLELRAYILVHLQVAGREKERLDLDLIAHPQ